MTLKLTNEQREALKGCQGVVPIEDEQTHEVYFLVDKVTLATLRSDADRRAIQQGIAEMESGRVVAIDELDARIQSRLGGQRSA